MIDIQVTVQTLLPVEYDAFLSEMASLYGQVERNLYVALRRGEKLNDLKREYQIKYGINARFFNSVYANLQGKIRSRDECQALEIDDILRRIVALESKIASLESRFNCLPCCNVKRQKKGKRANLRFELHGKKRKLATRQAKLKRLESTKPSLVFGRRKLWNAQFNLEGNGYKRHEEWLRDWRAVRASQFTVLGSGDEEAGCQNCQLTQEGQLSITVPYILQSLYGELVKSKKGKPRHCVIIPGIKFNYGQSDIDWALSHKQAITYRCVKKSNKWYLHASTDRVAVPIQTSKSNGALGIDLNPGGIGWAVCDREGNLQALGQLGTNIQDKSTEQTEAILGDIVKQLVQIAYDGGVPIAVENLDFRAKKASMAEKGVKYARMLSSFAYKKVYELLISRASRYGVEVITTNPAYSSQIGLVKFMSLYGLSSDTAAALVLARRILGYSERCPANYARFGAVQKKRHVWSTWAALSKAVKKAKQKLNKRIKRHDYFASRGTNSAVVVTLLEAETSSSKSKSTKKIRTLPTQRRDSSAGTADITARSACLEKDKYEQL